MTNKNINNELSMGVSEKEFFLALLKAKDEKDNQRFEAAQVALLAAFDALQTAINAALEAQKEAVLKAEAAAEKRFECVEISTPIVCADLIWRPAGELQVGDPLLALDENIEDDNNSRRGRRFRLAYVTENSIAEDELYEVVTSRGSIKCNGQHLWLSRENKRAWAGWKWIKTTDLTTGHEVNCPLDTWEVSNSYEAGWLAGMFDGEGCLSKGKGRVQLSITQRESQTSERIEKTLRQWTNRICCHRSVCAEGKRQKQTIFHFIITNRPEILKILGSVRPPRLMEMSEKAWNGMVMASHDRITTITSVKPIGVGKIARLSTSTHTYIAGGFAMHNSVNEFRALVNSMIATLIPRGEASIRFKSVEDKIQSLETSLGDRVGKLEDLSHEQKGQTIGKISVANIIVGILSGLAVIIGIVAAIVSWLN